MNGKIDSLVGPDCKRIRDLGKLRVYNIGTETYDQIKKGQKAIYTKYLKPTEVYTAANDDNKYRYMYIYIYI